MELKLLPYWIDVPFRTLFSTFGRVRENKITLLTGFLICLLPVALSVINGQYRSLIQSAIGVIILPVFLSPLFWQLTVGASFQTYIKTFKEAVTKKYTKLLSAYIIAFIALILIAQFVIVFPSQFFGFDGTAPMIPISENIQNIIATMYFIFLFGFFITVTTTFQFFDVIILTENVSPFEGFHKSYKIFRNNPLGVFMYTGMRGLIIVLVNIVPVVILTGAFSNANLLAIGIAGLVASASMTVVITIAYHIEFCNNQTEHLEYEYPYQKVSEQSWYKKITETIKNIN